MKTPTRKVFAGLGIALAAVMGFGSPALADTLSVSADRSQQLAAAGDKVVVTLSGVPANQGVYVRLCKGTLAEVVKARPTQCFGQGAWVSTDATQLAMGATDATKPVQLAVQATFTAGGANVDCQVDACGIHIRRDHNGGSTDFSLDRFIPVSFAAAAAKPSATALIKAGKVQYTVTNAQGSQLTFVINGKKYQRKATGVSSVFLLPAPKGKFAATVVLEHKLLAKFALTN